MAAYLIWRKAKLSSMGYHELAERLYYVDKTQRLEMALERFPSVYIEGAAASGKSTMVKMLLSRRPDVTYRVYDMQNSSDVRSFEADYRHFLADNKKSPFWVIFENMPQQLAADLAEQIKMLIESLSEDDRVILLGREPMEETFLALLWSRRLELLPQKVLLFTREEVQAFAETVQLWKYADEIYEVSCGMAGCVDLFLRILEKETETERCSVKKLCKSYEFRCYIERVILKNLSGQELDVIACARMLPWVDGKLLERILQDPDAVFCLERLKRKGIFLNNGREEHWKLAPVFRCCHEDDRIYDRDILLMAARYYEEWGYVQEALACYEVCKDTDGYRACAIRNYTRIPFVQPVYADVMHWEGDSPALSYLRGAYCYLVRDFAGLKKEMEKVRDYTDREVGLVYLNLCYMDPDTTLESWLQLAQNYAKVYGAVQLFHMLGDSRSYLCGIRDLSELFIGRKKEIGRKKQIWNTCLGEERWSAYLFALAEYNYEIEDKDGASPEQYQVVLAGSNENLIQTNLVRLHLLCKLWQSYQDVKITDAIDALQESMRFNQDYWGKVETLVYLQHLWRGESFALSWWKRQMRQAAQILVGVDNWCEWWYRAKGYLYLNKEERAAEILKELIPFFREYHYAYFLAEGLFVLAVVMWKMGDKSKALRYVIESLLVAQDYRYVGFYTRYGQSGYEVLEEYIAWLEKNEPEHWNRKKKYNYGDVRHMSYVEYVGVILRKAKKNRRIHPNIETFEESLTMMERIVLQDISQGLSNAQICEVHNLKLPTVKGHLYSLYKKLDVKNRVQAIKKAKELEILK